MSNFSGFPADLSLFFRDLAAHNNREWFEDNKQRYIDTLREPGAAFVVALGERLQDISAEIQYDPRTNGSGSMMRIYRDVRFSEDKSPYKSYQGFTFWEGTGKKKECPGFHVYMDANGAIVYGGVYKFTKPLLTAYREAVVDESLGPELVSILNAIPDEYELLGKHYKRVPRGFDKDHTRAEWLLYNSLGAKSPTIPHQIITSPDFVEACADHCRTLAPLQQWLARINVSE